MRSLAELEDRLATPRQGLIADLARLEGDILVLGAGGKLGPSLVALALNALQATNDRRRVIAVSRFGDQSLANRLRDAGATIIAADIAADGVLSSLPDAANVVFLVGSKFGSTGREAQTWFTNTYLPGRVAERYKSSRIVALSTGNVYPFTPVAGGGPTEAETLSPMGDYAMSCLGRERIFSHFSVANGTPTTLIRLNYAVEMRYGVLVDIARAVFAGVPVDVTMGAANVVWQGYANEVILRSLLLASSPTRVLNVAGPETISVRQIAIAMASRLGKEAQFTGTEAPTALLSNAGLCHALFGYPEITLGQLTEATADWVAAGLPLLDKATGFQRRDGQF